MKIQFVSDLHIDQWGYNQSPHSYNAPAGY